MSRGRLVCIDVRVKEWKTERVRSRVGKCRWWEAKKLKRRQRKILLLSNAEVTMRWEVSLAISQPSFAVYYYLIRLTPCLMG